MNLHANIPQRHEQDGQFAKLVYSVLVFLATKHHTIRPDDVVNLPDNLLDWKKLVEVDFLREWQASVQSMCNDGLEGVRSAGAARKAKMQGPATLAALLSAAKQSNGEALAELECAAIVIGNLIEDAIGETNPKIADAVQLQVNSFFHAALKTHLESESGEGDTE